MRKQSLKPEHFEEYGSDFLEFYYELAVSAEAGLAKRALADGRVLLKRLIELHSKAADIEHPDELMEPLSLLALAREFGCKKPLKAIRRRVVKALKDFSFRALFELNKGEACRDADRLCEAIISLHFARRAGFQEGQVLFWALKQAQRFSYKFSEQQEADSVLAQDNLVTHVIYVQSDYGRLKLPPARFKPEMKFIKWRMPACCQSDDIEGVAEFTDSLRILGVPDSHPLMVKALRYLLTKQESDGRFGEADWDFYDRYHSTWTALNALRSFHFKGRGPVWKAWRKTLGKKKKSRVVPKSKPTASAQSGL